MRCCSFRINGNRTGYDFLFIADFLIEVDTLGVYFGMFDLPFLCLRCILLYKEDF